MVSGKLLFANDRFIFIYRFNFGRCAKLDQVVFYWKQIKKGAIPFNGE